MRRNLSIKEREEGGIYMYKKRTKPKQQGILLSPAQVMKRRKKKKREEGGGGVLLLFSLSFFPPVGKMYNKTHKRAAQHLIKVPLFLSLSACASSAAAEAAVLVITYLRQTSSARVMLALSQKTFYEIPLPSSASIETAAAKCHT